MVLKRNSDRPRGLVGRATEAWEQRSRPDLAGEHAQQNQGVVNADPTRNDPQTLAEPGRPDRGVTGAEPTRNDPNSFTITGPSELPPSYADSVGTARSIASGGPVSEDKSSTGSRAGSESDADSDGFDVESLDEDEEDWALDEAVPDPPSYRESESEHRTSAELVQDVLDTRPPRTTGPESFEPQRFEPLPCPVIIPQRRPGDKGRGFVRAYAPVLGYNGIGMEQFLSFLKSFHKASQASPIFTAIQVSADVGGLTPGVISLAVMTAMQVAAHANRAVQTRQKANHFLDCMNEEMFVPAGLYAMVIKYKQDLNPNRSDHFTPLGHNFGIGTEKINLTASHAIAKVNRTVPDPTSRALSHHMQDLRLTSSTTRGTVELPEAAPLIFPYLDRAIDLNGTGGLPPNAVQDHGVFLQDYQDRRLQALSGMDKPSNGLALSEDKRSFDSKLADPAQSANQTGYLGLVSTAILPTLQNRYDRRSERRSEKHERRSDKRLARSERRVERYEQRLDAGRPLSRHKQSKYERHLRTTDVRPGLVGGLSGRGRGGLVGALVGAVAQSLASDGKRPMQDVYDPRSVTAPQAFSSSSTIPRAGGPVRRLMKEDVLYLIIVNMPSEAELAEAQGLLGI